MGGTADSQAIGHAKRAVQQQEQLARLSWRLLTYLFICFYSVKHVCATLRMITSHIQVFVCFHFTDTSSDPRSRGRKQHES